MATETLQTGAMPVTGWPAYGLDTSPTATFSARPSGDPARGDTACRVERDPEMRRVPGVPPVVRQEHDDVAVPQKPPILFQGYSFGIITGLLLLLSWLGQGPRATAQLSA
jgi:hypothetical protein